jgi:hypothetical protein
MKTVLALYALFEDEIGRWLPIDRRNGNYWAKRVRLGQETFDKLNNSTSRYTPQAFTEAIYCPAKHSRPQSCDEPWRCGREKYYGSHFPARQKQAHHD